MRQDHMPLNTHLLKKFLDKKVVANLQMLVKIKKMETINKKMVKIKKKEIRNRKMIKNLRIKEEIVQEDLQAEIVQEVVVLILVPFLELQEVYWED